MEKHGGVQIQNSDFMGVSQKFFFGFISTPAVDRFKSLRCLNDHIDLPYMMGSFASGNTNSLVAKIGTKDFATTYSVYRF